MYERMYHRLFNAVTNALFSMDEFKFACAREQLEKGQLECEEMYMVGTENAGEPAVQADESVFESGYLSNL